MKDRGRGTVGPWPSTNPARMSQAPAGLWVCEVCESSPATVTCKADAVALCAACDADIHSANPLAQRHVRVPIYQHKFFGGTMSHSHHLSDKFTTEGGMEQDDDSGDDEQEANSWLLFQPAGKNSTKEDVSFLFGGGGGNGGTVEEYLDLVDYGEPCPEEQSQAQSQYSRLQQQQEDADGADRIVPAKSMEVKCQQQSSNQQQYLEFEFENQKGGYGYSGSLIHSIAPDVGIVPEAAINEYSGSYFSTPNGSLELSTGTGVQVLASFTPMDREARVLRYREKRKNRKFEKTIRYASRKAYAETRPRIKGRFAKRTDVEVEVDQIYSSAMIVETGYGVVPTF
ncbi:zinc finger protein CONSTANS-LIKE 2-like [Nymphaea colorata]|nr:zinc finger protein CONSTANS-LIKE 2-like [Nymphaea colorata]